MSLTLCVCVCVCVCVSVSISPLRLQGITEDNWRLLEITWGCWDYQGLLDYWRLLDITGDYWEITVEYLGLLGILLD